MEPYMYSSPYSHCSKTTRPSFLRAYFLFLCAASTASAFQHASSIRSRQAHRRLAEPKNFGRALPTNFGAVDTSAPAARRKSIHARKYKSLDEEEDGLEQLPPEPQYNTTTRSSSRFFGAYDRIRRLPRRILSRPNKTGEPEPTIVVSDVHELRDAVLGQKIPLKEVGFNLTAPTVNATSVQAVELMNHSVLQLISQRIQTNSTPSNRAPTDKAHLSLSIEGGGMRGAVSAGMAAAIASLGLTDAFDSVYGSSAGSIVGAYMVSRQMCVDVYTQVLPAAKGRFACKRRVIGNLGVGYVNDLVARLRESRGGTTGSSNGNAIQTSEGMLVQNDAERTSPADKSTGRLSTIMSRFPFSSKRFPIFWSSIKPYLTLSPGMNISFVLDGIMNEQHGLRPFDAESFRINDAKQPLLAVSSTVRNGKLETVAFSSREGDYWDVEEESEVIIQEGRAVRASRAVKRKLSSAAKLLFAAVRRTSELFLRFTGRFVSEQLEQDDDSKLTIAQENRKRIPTAGRRALFGLRRGHSKIGEETKKSNKTEKKKVVVREATSCPDNSGKKGFFACLESSMLVPGAAGAPVKLLRRKHREEAKTSGVGSMASVCFDAFCYEPIPYRSAVENGATHVLALRSRPDGCFVETVPALYEKLVAPLYFRINGLPQVVEFFESGGSQYRYLEDVLTLDEGLSVGCTNASSPDFMGVKVPPPDILFGTDNDDKLVVDTDSWNRAHLLPVILPAGTPELPTLTQEKDEVLLAVRNGYAAAFDMLASIAGLDFDPSTVDSKRVAELIFPKREDEDVDVLENPVLVKGEVIENYELEQKKRRRFIAWIASKRRARRDAKKKALRSPMRAAAIEVERESPDTKQYVKDDSLDWLEAEALLAALPGFQEGKLQALAEGLAGQRDESFAEAESAGTMTRSAIS